MTQPDFDKLCKRWQKRLRMQNWKITARMKNAEAMGPNNGFVEFEITHLSADVDILETLDDAKLERTVIHEFLHLMLAHWEFPESDRAQGDAQETAINVLADSFYALAPRRRNK